MSNSFQIYYIPNGSPQVFYPPLSGIHTFKLKHVSIDALFVDFSFQIVSPQLQMKYSSDNINEFSGYYTTHSGINKGPLIIFPFTNVCNQFDNEMIFTADFSTGFELQVVEYNANSDSLYAGVNSVILTIELLN